MRATRGRRLCSRLLYLCVLLLSAAHGQPGGGYTSSPEVVSSEQGQWQSEVRGVCGGCKKLLKRFKKVSMKALLDLADKQQGGGDVVGASMTMCAAVCAMTAQGTAHPELPGATSNLGVLFKEHGLLPAAEECYRMASRLEPRNAGHHYRMGNARLARQELELARQSYMRATRRWGTFGDAYNNLGNCLMGMSRFHDAAAAYEFAVKSSPKNANYLVNLGGVRARDDLPGAIELLQRALATQPNFGEAWNNLANLYRDQGILDKAAAAYEDAHKFMRGSGEVLVNLASVRGYLCEWRGRDELLQQIVALSEQQLQQGMKVSLSPFYANTFGCTPDLLLALARNQARSTAAAVSYLLPLPNWLQPSRLSFPILRLRVGFLSSDLTNHIVGHGISSLMALWKEQQQAIDVYAFALTASDESAPRAAMERLAHSFKRSLFLPQCFFSIKNLFLLQLVAASVVAPVESLVHSLSRSFPLLALVSFP